MELGLSGKVALITGASKGIGRAIAVSLAAEAMKLVVVARSAGLLEELAASLPGAEILVQTADSMEPEAPARAVAAAIARFGRLDLLVNNAGASKRGDFLTLTETDFAQGFGIKLFGAVRFAQAAWPHLQASQGNMINIIGVGAKMASAEFTIGGPVNAALMNFTKALADRGVKDGVRVNAINPGSIETDRLTSRIVKLAGERGVDHAAATELLGKETGVARFGQPAEIANAVAFLASDQASYFQGAIIDVDGGWCRAV